MVKLLVAIIPAVLLIAIAILSVQNATPVAVTFLTGTTVALPLGIWIAFSLGAGMIGTALLLSFFGSKSTKTNRL